MGRAVVRNRQPNTRMSYDPSRKASGLGLSALSALCALACASTSTTEAKARAKHVPGKGTLAAQTDRSRCEHEGRGDRHVAEAKALSSREMSIRRVYRVVGDGEQRRRILLCREADTNLDGHKDLVRQYDDQGEPVEETADANYDGVIDTWIRFAKGRVVQVDLDHAWDGQPDETRYYSAGKLTRIERDTNQDGKADIWEIYLGGHLDRMGVDGNFDGRVDRWNRDNVRRSEAAQADAKDTSAAGVSSAPGKLEE